MNKKKPKPTKTEKLLAKIINAQKPEKLYNESILDLVEGNGLGFVSKQLQAQNAFLEKKFIKPKNRSNT